MMVRLLRPLYVGGSAQDTGATVDVPDELAEDYCKLGMAEEIESVRAPAPRKKRRASSAGLRRRVR